MKLTFLRVRNCLSFGNSSNEIKFRDFTTIVGPNNSGKTNVLRAISLVGQALQERRVERRSYCHKGDTDIPVEVEIGIALDSSELAAISDFLTCISLSEDIRVRADSDDRKERLESLRDELIEKFYRPKFTELFQDIAIRLIFSNEDRYGAELCLVLRHQNLEIFIPGLNQLSLSLKQLGSYHVKTFGQIALDELRSRYQSEFELYVKGQSDSPPTVEIKPLTFELLYDILKIDKPTVMETSSRRFTDFENKLKDKPPFISLRKFLLEHGFAEEYIGLCELFSLIYNSAIIRLSDMRSKPKTIQELTRKPELAISRSTLLTGEELPEILFALKNSGEIVHVKRYMKIVETFQKLTDGLSFDVAIRTKETKTEGAAQVSPLIHSAQIQIIQDDFPVPLDFAAAGIVETLLLLTAIVGHASKILLVDEPALNLHPSMQKRIMEELIISMEQNHNQVVLVTHSPYFISGSRLENTYRLVMGRDGTEIIDVGETIRGMRGEDRQKLALRLGNVDVRALMFARGVVFVEGPAEKNVIELIDRILSSKRERVTLDEREWNVLSLGGKSNLPAFIDLAKKLRINFAAILDNDAWHEICSALRNCGFPEKDLKINEKLREMTRKYGIFVFKEDLERAMEIEVSPRESKPLKVLQELIKKIEEGSIPSEILEIMEYLDNYVNSYK